MASEQVEAVCEANNVYVIPVMADNWMCFERECNGWRPNRLRQRSGVTDVSF